MTTQLLRSGSGREALGWLARQFRTCAGVFRSDIELSGMKARDLADIGLRAEPAPYW